MEPQSERLKRHSKNAAYANLGFAWLWYMIPTAIGLTYRTIEKLLYRFGYIEFAKYMNQNQNPRYKPERNLSILVHLAVVGVVILAWNKVLAALKKKDVKETQKSLGSWLSALKLLGVMMWWYAFHDLHTKRWYYTAVDFVWVFVFGVGLFVTHDYLDFIKSPNEDRKRSKKPRIKNENKV